MGREETVFERQALYDEVWKDPVRTVAQRYGISDVGLRKICNKLGVPLPPLGYWARVRAGRTPRIPSLRADHKGQTRYIRSFYVDDEAPEKERRAARLLAQTRPATWPAITIPATLDNVHLTIRRTARSIGNRARKAETMVSSKGSDSFGVNVSDAQKDRALRILDGVLTAFLSAGATFTPGKGDQGLAHLEVVGQFVSFRLEEQMDHSLREPTAKELAEQAEYSWRRIDLRVYKPNGKLKLTVLSDNKYSPYLTAGDGSHARLEERCSDIVQRVWTKAAAKNIEAQMREEQHQRWVLVEQRRQKIEAARRDVMDKVQHVEKFLQKWQRATLLRQFADALDGIESGIQHGNSVIDPAWIRKAADWLDPLIAKPWPEIDGDEPDTGEDEEQFE